MFNKDVYLEELEKVMNDKVLSDFVSLEYNDIEEGLQDIYLILRKNKDVILDLVDIDNSNLNYLVSSVVNYCNNNTDKLPFVIESMIERKNFAKDFDDRKFLASLIYLLNTDNKYSDLVTSVLYNYTSIKIGAKTKKKLSLLENKNRFINVLDILENIITDKDYSITLKDIKLLEELNYNTKPIKEIPMIKLVLAATNTTDYQLLAKFLGLNSANYKYKNNYFNGSKIISDVKKITYQAEELSILKLLNLTIKPYNQSNELSILDCLSLEINSKKPNFFDVIKFVKLYDKYTDNKKEIDFRKISKCLKLTNNLYNKTSYYYDDADIFRKIYDEYRNNNFSFKIDEFCNYINSIKKERFLEEKIIHYKVLDSNSDFDIYSFIYLLGSVSNSKELNRFAPYIPHFLETKSGKKYFTPLLEKEMEAINYLEDTYSLDTLNRLLPYAYDLASKSDYSMGSYAKKFIDSRDYYKFKAVCTWLRNNNKDIFKESIDNKSNIEKDRKRSILEATNYFSNLKLKEIKPNTIYKYYKSLELPYSDFKKKNHILGERTISNIANSLYKKKLESICLVETKQLLLLASEGKSLTQYIDSRDYDYKQVFDIVSMAGKQIEDKSSLTILLDRIKKEVVITEQETRLKEASSLIDMFKNSSFDSLGAFHDFVKNEYGISREKQAVLFDVAKGNKELSKIIAEKELEIKEKRSIRVTEQSRKKTLEKPDYNMGKYGEEVVKAMRTFTETDNITIKNFCRSADISEKEFRFYKKLCQEIDDNLVIEVNDKCRDISRKFVAFIVKSANEIALEMKRCHKEKEPYNLYAHYEKYSISPFLIANISSRFNKVNASKLISQYITIHSDIFTSVSSFKIENMKRKTSIYNANFYLENQSVSYSKNNLDQAINNLCEKGIPLYNGTLYQALKKNKEDVKKTYIKTKPNN